MHLILSGYVSPSPFQLSLYFSHFWFTVFWISRSLSLSPVSSYSLFFSPLHFSLPLCLLPQGHPDGHQGAVVSSMEDCRSEAKWPLNGSQTHTGFIDALAWRQLSTTLCVCVGGRVVLIAMLIIQNCPTPLWKLLNIDGVWRQDRDRWETRHWLGLSCAEWAIFIYLQYILYVKNK